MTVIPSIVLELAIVACLLGIIGHLVLVVGTREGAIVVLGLLCAAIFRLLPLIIRSLSALQLLAMGKPSLNLMVSEIASIEQTYEQQADIYPKNLCEWQKIELRGVSYTYPDGCLALDDINVVILE